MLLRHNKSIQGSMIQSQTEDYITVILIGTCIVRANANSKTYGYNNRDQLVSITDTNGLNTTYSYDETGNQTEKTENGTTSTFNYTARQRVKSITIGGAPPISYQYDYSGQRVNQQNNGSEKRYIYDGLTLIAETNTLGNTLAQYHYGNRYQLAETRNNTNIFYHVDSLSTNVAVTNTDGSIQARYEYDAYGNLLTQDGSSEQPFGFTGYQKDDDTGLYNANARYYDSNTARFLREDPLFGNPENPPSLHRYNYTANNPTYFVDPTGEGDEAAHFYNEYLDSRAAGLNVIDSLIVALGAQYPDKVDKYDAKSVSTSFIDYSRDYTRKNNRGLHALTNSFVKYTVKAVDYFQTNLAKTIYHFALSEHPGKDSGYHIPKDSINDPEAMAFTEITGHGLSEGHTTDLNFIYPDKELQTSIMSMKRIYKFGIKSGRITENDPAFKVRMANRIQQIKIKQTQLEEIFKSETKTYCSIKAGYCSSSNPRGKDKIEFELLSELFNEDTSGEFKNLRPENIDVGKDFSTVLGLFDTKTLRLLNGFSEVPGWGEGMSDGLLIDALDSKFDMSAKYVRNSINDSIDQQIQNEAATVIESIDDLGVKLKFTNND